MTCPAVPATPTTPAAPIVATAPATAPTLEPARAARYLAPSPGVRRFNALASWLVRRGVGLWGARILVVPGRRSGEPRHTVVNLLEHDGRTYLVAPRGNAHWVRNLRAAGAGELRVGRRAWTFDAAEVADVAKPELLAAYLDRWAFEAGTFFDVEDRTDRAQLLAVAADHPAFELVDLEPVSRNR